MTIERIESFCKLYGLEEYQIKDVLHFNSNLIRCELDELSREELVKTLVEVLHVRHK